MAKLITRRNAILSIGSALTLAGCNGGITAGFLKGMEKWNEWFQELLFSSSRLAPEQPVSATTPEMDFPVYFISDMMPMPPVGWTLKVGGLVAHPGNFTLEQLAAMPSTTMRIQHHCVEGWSAVAQWSGPRVSELARIVQVDPRARYVEFRSFDAGYWSSWDMPSAMHPQTILALQMNGHALPSEHGAPLRLYSSVKLGYKNVKYVNEINFLSERTGGYWENQGYEWFAGT